LREDVKTIALKGPPYLPFLSQDAIDFLATLIRPGLRVFEWGAGGSTIWLAQHGVELTSIEHSQEWVALVETILKELGLTVDLQLIDTKQGTDSYVNVIGEFPDEYFDLILSDGVDESRFFAPKAAVPKLKPGGWMVVDNLSWNPVECGIDAASMRTWLTVTECGWAVGYDPEVCTGPRHGCTGFFQKPKE
jgi:predicted O-methyltransferase YrrM